MGVCGIKRVNPFRTAVSSVFGDKPFKFQVVCPQIGTAVLKGLRTALLIVIMLVVVIFFFFFPFH